MRVMNQAPTKPNAATRSRRARWLGVVMVAVLPLAACTGKAANREHDANAAKVEKIDGSELSRVTLTAAAAKRLDLALATVKAAPVGTEIPYAAVLYDPDGHTWTFAKVKGLTFERKAITVKKITGDVALLESGPPVGTVVVTQGTNELYGAEIGVGDE